MMVESEKPVAKKNDHNLNFKMTDGSIPKTDGVPSIERSYSKLNEEGKNGLMSTSKFLLNEDDDEEDDRLSNITEIV